MLGVIVESKRYRLDTIYICFCNIYLLASLQVVMTFSKTSYTSNIKPKTRHCDVQCFFMLGANEQDISARTLT